MIGAFLSFHSDTDPPSTSIRPREAPPRGWATARAQIVRPTARAGAEARDRSRPHSTHAVGQRSVQTRSTTLMRPGKTLRVATTLRQHAGRDCAREPARHYAWVLALAFTPRRGRRPAPIRARPGEAPSVRRGPGGR